MAAGAAVAVHTFQILESTPPFLVSWLRFIFAQRHLSVFTVVSTHDVQYPALQRERGCGLKAKLSANYGSARLSESEVMLFWFIRFTSSLSIARLNPRLLGAEMFMFCQGCIVPITARLLVYSHRTWPRSSSPPGPTCLARLSGGDMIDTPVVDHLRDNTSAVITMSPALILCGAPNINSFYYPIHFATVGVIDFRYRLFFYRSGTPRHVGDTLSDSEALHSVQTGSA